MTRKSTILLCGLMPLALAASRQPVLSQVSGGLWEISGRPGARATQLCVAAPALLAQIEHRGPGCTRTVVRNDPSLAVVEYSCGARGFGHSEFRVLTPRSLRIETQGISNGVPFSYVVQARRKAEC